MLRKLAQNQDLSRMDFFEVLLRSFKGLMSVKTMY